MSVSQAAPEDELPAGPLLRLVHNQRVAFLAVGAFNTLNGFLLFVAVQAFLGDSFAGYMTALALSHVVAVLCAFVLHRRFVFRVRDHLWLDLARFELVNLSALGLNAALLPLFVEKAGLPVLLAQCAAASISIVSTYFAHRFFSFRRPAATVLSVGTAS
jgi:putative flippase GtrA